MNNFNRIAPFYDSLKKLVFGRACSQAEKVHLHTIKPQDTVLIIGGGTGEILEHIPLANMVTFIEKSSKMLIRAKRRSCSAPLNFLESDFFDFKSNQKFDIIICSFFLDVFTAWQLWQAIRKVKQLLASDGQLIVTDFRQTGKPLSSFLIWFMHRFFRFTSNLSSKKLQPILQKLEDHGFEVKDFYGHMIFSAVLKLH